MRTTPLIPLVLFCVAGAMAHEVTWWQNEDGSHPFTPVVIAYSSLEDINQFAKVKPSSGEACTVVVHVDPPSSPYLTATVNGANPDNAVDIEISLIKVPNSTNQISANITGYWSATGSPDPVICDATNKNFFTIPVVIAMTRQRMAITWYHGRNTFGSSREDLWVYRDQLALQGHL